ncbi:STAS domain-containing protein [Streptomyces sp. NPDC004787]|uniref:STAS domain-containing protein n=1 Tax=Streptomyces sp. NPDC004787 TaxID=3154291 RepID=UPI0033B8F7FC
MTSDKEGNARPGDELQAPREFVVWVRGDLDIDHADQLRPLLLDGVDLAPHGTDIVIDLQNSSFCDSTGLNLLLAARERALAAGNRITLAAPSHQMIRLLEITGSADLFGLGPAAERRPR